ncbi:MAG TPA: ROK family protein [Candidatus Angelobacter sp.]|nr:ROK family protein [Candidatus Angelobacter sp.]
MTSFAIGVDLGLTNLRVAAVGSDGNVLDRITNGTQMERGRNLVIDQICTDIRTLAAKWERTLPFAGVGIGMPGIIDMEGGMLKDPNLPDWLGYPLREELEQRLGTTVVLENDANAAALGEKWLGAGRQVDDLCVLTLGTGVGGGLVLKGRIWHGMTGMAAELGHITVDPEGVLCVCGNRGCLEQYASATAIKRMAQEAIAAGHAPELAACMDEEDEPNVKAVFQMAVQGNAAAAKIFHRVGESLGLVLANLINIFNLPMYLLGGGVANAWEAFAPSMIEEVRRRSFVYVTTNPDEKSNGSIRGRTIVSRALLGSDAGLFGAARLPMIAAGLVQPAQELKQG